MISRAMYKQRRGRRWLTALAVLSILTGTAFVGGTALAVGNLDRSLFELDKDAANDVTSTRLGTLGSQIANTTTTSINVCRTAPTEPAFPFTILIDAERMSVTAGVNGNFGGNCAGGTKRTYTVTRGFDSTSTSQHSSAENVTLLTFGAVSGEDWDQVYAQVIGDPDTTCSGLRAESDPNKIVACSWVHDGRATSIFTSSKDYDEISAWQWRDQSVPDADELDDGFAIKYDNGDETLFFGADRFATNGSKDAGFWFFHRAVSPVEPVGTADGTFTGLHTEPDPGDNGVFCLGSPGFPTGSPTPNCSPYDADDTGGDILVLTTFTNGGAVTSIRVFEWIGPAGSTAALIQRGAAGDCVPGDSSQDLCATVNNTTVESPWPYDGKGEPQDDAINAGGLMEGGVNLTELGLEGCFSSFMATSRSSPSLTADPKDFILGNFQACDTDIETTPSNSTGQALTDGDDDDSLPEAQLGTGAAGVDVTDVAALDVKGTDDFTGTLSFFICGPITSGTCETGGVPAGSQTVTADGNYTSEVVNLTEVGRYCWRGEFDSGTEGVPDDADSSEGECFEVLPVQPTLTTQAGDDVTLGDPISDTATLTGTAYQPGTDGGVDGTYTSINATMDTPANGTITFTLVGPDDCTSVPAGFTPIDVTVSGDSSTAYTASFTPTAVGLYTWIAEYSGDSPNTLSAGPTGCPDNNEEVVVTGNAQLSTEQDWLPNDTATLTGDTNLTGTLTFTLYNDGSCGQDGGTAQYTETINVSDATSGSVFSTSNSSVKATATGDWSWLVSYDDDVLTDPTDDCEVTSLTITN